jgi:hypothetical protein
MKFKLTALILALTVASWAQTATPNPSASAPQENTAPQANADCCHKNASANQGQSCCRHEMAGKDEKAMSCGSGEKASACCSGKEAKSCMEGDKDKTAAACGECCGKGHEKGCCSSHDKDDKTAMSCGDDKQCGDHCAAHASASASK